MRNKCKGVSMTVFVKLAAACAVMLAVCSPGLAQTAVEEISDEQIIIALMAQRDFCKMTDAARSADYDKAFTEHTNDAVDAVKALVGKPDTEAAVAKVLAEKVSNSKDPAQPGYGKELCKNYLVAGGIPN
jgi:hypothetical protein